jgi:hypothetical protein
MKRIMTIEALKRGKILGSQQDGSREFISLLACISAAGKRLPPLLIYKGESHDILDTWVEDFEEEDEAWFACTDNGWSCDSIGRQWLLKLFDRYTKVTGARRRLLLVDGHSSHVNMSFLDLADSLRIIILVLPPHTTHRLQPLDVGLFQPLSTFYSAALNRTIYESQSFTNMTKRLFWTVFKEAWEAAFTVENIKKAWEKAGVYPIDSSKTLSMIGPKPEPEQPPENPRTPMTCRSIRRVIKAYQTEPEKAVETLFRAAERLATQHEIDTHVNKGLRKALVFEKKKRRKGRKLNLLGEDNSAPQLFSPGRVQAAKAFQAQKEAIEVERKAAVAQKKAQGLENRLQKEKEKQERALQRAIRKEEVQEAKAQKQAEVQARKEAQKAAKEVQEQTKLESIRAKELKKASPTQTKQESASEQTNAPEGDKEVEKVTRKGRVIKPPRKL